VNRRVLAVLREARADVTIAELCATLRLPRRVVEAAIEDLRRDGQPLVSSSRGVRYTDDPAEVRACVDALRRRAAQQFITARSLRRTAGRLTAERVERGPVEQVPIW
jgi:hypothetical protein